jgi:hypothetical protein
LDVVNRKSFSKFFSGELISHWLAANDISSTSWSVRRLPVALKCDGRRIAVTVRTCCYFVSPVPSTIISVSRVLMKLYSCPHPKSTTSWLIMILTGNSMKSAPSGGSVSIHSLLYSPLLASVIHEVWWWTGNSYRHVRHEVIPVSNMENSASIVI